MLRRAATAAAGGSYLPSHRPIAAGAHPLRGLASRSTESEAPSATELDEARQWLADFGPEVIPHRICNVSFSRSSGPGGQNVNKVNSKATLRLPLSSLLPLLPSLLHSRIQSSRFRAIKADAIVIQADGSRKQADNVKECFQKLHDMVVEAGKGAIPGETSKGQRDRVKGLKRAENEARLRSKKTHSTKKSSRRGGGRSSI